MQHPDICIAGAGIIGLSLALELHHRGLRVTVFDRGNPLAEASTAAAGMLAASDPDNPPQLRPLADLSLELYPAFLERLHSLSGMRVPFHTHTTLQSLPHHILTAAGALTTNDLTHLLPALVPRDHRFIILDEHSLDPRELAAALLAAVQATSIDLRAHAAVHSIQSHPDSIEIYTATGVLHAARFVDCTGAWAATTSSLGVTPKKGQMLSVSLPSSFPLHLVVRTPDIYIVPRTTIPGAAVHAIIGATVEDAGFDKTVHPSDIARLRSLAATLLPVLSDVPELESWAGLRPATPDGLPLLGAFPGCAHHYIATGHYRNGILLAPVTALLMTQTIMGEPVSLDLSPFSPTRFPAPPK
jgi:glycine oxidase